MPGNYRRKSTRNSWSKYDMEKAIEDIRQKKIGWLLASKKYNVPQATLRRHFHKIPLNLGRFKPTFEEEIERQIVKHILYFEQRFFGFTTKDVRKLAYQFAVRAGIKHRFDDSKQMAGWDWLAGFRARNPQLSLRAPEPTSAARARAFNKPQVEKFFTLLEKIIIDENIPPQHIYNMDESGLSTVQKPPKIFALRGKKQVGALTSAERGQHVSVVVCANAAGSLVPPALIFPRKNHKAEYFDGAPAGSLELCYESGYMVGELFLIWMKHFVKSVGSNSENKVLLILDGHLSHKYIEALEFAKINGVIMLCLPPHCTHRMQPLDVAFFGPLDSYYNTEITTWLKNHPGRTVGLYQVSRLFGKAYGQAASVGNITSGFEKTGIHPLNPNIFPDHIFSPSEVTENIVEIHNDVQNVSPGPSTSGVTSDQNLILQTLPANSSEQRLNDISEPPTSFESGQPDHVNMETSSSIDILKVLSPVPRAISTGQLRKTMKRVTGSQVLTSSPYMGEAKAQAQKKIDKENQKNVRKTTRKQVKRVLEIDENQHEDFESDADDDAACIYCNELYSKSKAGEHWVCCQSCLRWCHTLCADVPVKIKKYTCELCIDT